MLLKKIKKLYMNMGTASLDWTKKIKVDHKSNLSLVKPIIIDCKAQRPKGGVAIITVVRPKKDASPAKSSWY
jgi:hypothetical protein